MISVVLPGALRQFTGGVGTVQLEPAGCTLADVLDALADAHPALVRRIRDEQGAVRRYVNVYVNGDDVRTSGGLATPVTAGDELLVLASVAGG